MNMSSRRKVFCIAEFLFFGVLCGYPASAVNNEACQNNISDCQIGSAPQQFDCGRNISWKKTDIKHRHKSNTYNLVELDQISECNQYSISTDFKLERSGQSEYFRWKFDISPWKRNDSAYLLVVVNQRNDRIELPDNVESTIRNMAYVSHVIRLEFYSIKTLSSISNPDVNHQDVDVTFNVTDDRELNEYSCNRHQIANASVKLACVQKKNGQWTEEGCRTNESTHLSVTCQCKVEKAAAIGVKTSFNTLVGSVSSMPVYFAETLISTLFLFVTLLVLVRCRRVYRDPNRRYIAQLNLTISLLLRHSCLLIGFGLVIFNPLNRHACEFVAVLHVYFLITTVLWVLIEGLIIYRKVCKSSLAFNIRVIIAITVSIWLFPFIILVTLSAIEINKNSFIMLTESYKVIAERVETVYQNNTDLIGDEMLNYRKYEYCWTSSSIVVVTIYITVLFAIVVNAIVLVWVGVVVWKIRSADADNTPEAVRTSPRIHTQTIDTFRAIVILTTVLNIPWLLSTLFNLIHGIEKNTSLIPAYVHSFLVFLQGPLLFYVYCIQKKELKAVIRRKIISHSVKYSIGSRRSPNRVSSHSG